MGAFTALRHSRVVPEEGPSHRIRYENGARCFRCCLCAQLALWWYSPINPPWQWPKTTHKVRHDGRCLQRRGNAAVRGRLVGRSLKGDYPYRHTRWHFFPWPLARLIWNILAQRPGEKRRLRVRFHRRDHFRAPCEHCIPKLSLDGGMFGLIGLTTLLAFIFPLPQGTHCPSMRWLQNLAIVSPLFPFLAVMKQDGLQQKSAVNHRCVPPPMTRGRKPAHTGLFFRIIAASPEACHHAGTVSALSICS